MTSPTGYLYKIVDAMPDGTRFTSQGLFTEMKVTMPKMALTPIAITHKLRLRDDVKKVGSYEYVKCPAMTTVVNPQYEQKGCLVKVHDLNHLT